MVELIQRDLYFKSLICFNLQKIPYLKPKFLGQICAIFKFDLISVTLAVLQGIARDDVDARRCLQILGSETASRDCLKFVLNSVIFSTKIKQQKIHTNKIKEDLGRRRRNDLLFDMHLSLICRVFQSTHWMSKSSKSRCIVINFDFRIDTTGVWSTYCVSDFFYLLFSHFSLLVSMAPLSKEIRPVSSCVPQHIGPAIPEVRINA